VVTVDVVFPAGDTLKTLNTWLDGERYTVLRVFIEGFEDGAGDVSTGLVRRL
jgi:hypothetical protein